MAQPEKSRTAILLETGATAFARKLPAALRDLIFGEMLDDGVVGEYLVRHPEQVIRLNTLTPIIPKPSEAKPKPVVELGFLDTTKGT
jgi:hypothetical protein